MDKPWIIAAIINENPCTNNYSRSTKSFVLNVCSSRGAEHVNADIENGS